MLTGIHMFTMDDYKYAMKHPKAYDEMRQEAFDSIFWKNKDKLYDLKLEKNFITLMTN